MFCTATPGKEAKPMGPSAEDPQIDPWVGFLSWAGVWWGHGSDPPLDSATVKHEVSAGAWFLGWEAEAPPPRDILTFPPYNLGPPRASLLQTSPAHPIEEMDSGCGSSHPWLCYYTKRLLPLRLENPCVILLFIGIIKHLPQASAVALQSLCLSRYKAPHLRSHPPIISIF